MNKSIFSVLTVVIMLLSSSVVSANAFYDFEVNGIFYNYLNKAKRTVAVTHKSSSPYDYNGEYSGNIVIPDKVSYKGATYSVTEIASYAFECRTELTGITIPNSVTCINPSAFAGCTKLAKINLPNSITEIGMNAFSNTAWWENQANGILYLGNYCIGFKGIYNDDRQKEASITIKENTRVIADYAFSFWSGLSHVTLPNSLTHIGKFAFRGCNLSEITLPKSLKMIDDNAFEGCRDLKNVILLNPTPPELGFDVFRWPIIDNITLTVPINSLNRYKTAPSWKSIKKIVGKNL